MPMNGVALGSVGVGALLVYAGLTGRSVLSTIQAIVQGKSPGSVGPTQLISETTIGQDMANAKTASGQAQSGLGSVGNPSQYQAYAFSQFSKYGWGSDQQQPLVLLWNQESGWNAYAANPTSNARGIPQNINGWSAYAPGDWKAQIDWGLNYISGRYGTPGAAWAHEQANN